ncbi:kelch-like protein 15 isoform X2 [Rhinatrema bivittatum]|uniref:kelch-like protein 15 isoform X2 n=1 Tax=Rhinatrema bivittatum TaxID=194408 RepID=UPI0011285A7F|nr:kelch-like protein 15 isoform X2 [Rhinatrema bivittatum]
MAGVVEGYSSSIHDTTVSAGFRALYEEGLLLDVTLVIEDHPFQAHKALLATQSDYFRIMFTADMRERDQDKIHLKGLTATGFSHVLQFMYYGNIELSMTTVHEILQAAMYVQLTEVVKTSEFFRYSRQLRHEVEQALNYFHSIHEQPLMEMKSNRIRSAKAQTAVFRGMIGHSMVNSKILLLHKPRVWWELEGPQVPLRPDCLAIINNFVFLLGGEELGPDGEFHASSKVFRYDPRQNNWLRMSDMSVPRSEFAVGVIGRYIYAVAGRTRDETFYSTERYDITEDKWEFVDPYPVNKYGHEGTVLSNKLYITGGITSSSTSKQVCVFDPSKEGTVEQRTRRTQVLTNCWENRCKMNYARCFHKMISYSGKLYVFGGVCVILRASFESQGCPSTEVYDPDTDQWTILASMPIGRSGHGVAVLDKQIMVLGGLCYNGHYSDSILTFDPEENKWKEDEYPRMPCKLDGLQVCSLHFPEYVLEHVRRCS